MNGTINSNREIIYLFEFFWNCTAWMRFTMAVWVCTLCRLLHASTSWPSTLYKFTGTWMQEEISHLNQMNAKWMQWNTSIKWWCSWMLCAPFHAEKTCNLQPQLMQLDAEQHFQFECRTFRWQSFSNLIIRAKEKHFHLLNSLSKSNALILST